MRHSRGFTLLELMAVLAVMGILASIAFPSFTYLSANTRLKSASTDLYLSILRARSEAVKRNGLVSVTAVGGDWTKGWQIMIATVPNGSFDRVISDNSALKGVRVTSTVTSIVFLSSGRIQGAVTPSMLIESPTVSSIKRCLSADLTGRPYIKPSAC